LDKIPHISVLPDEVVEAFKSIDSGAVLDCTLGFGGHSSLLLSSNPNLTLIGNDQDEEALSFATQRLAPFGERFSTIQGRFSTSIDKAPHDSLRGILADIGVSSFQLDELERGFSFESQTLDMRMDPNALLDAKHIINHYTPPELERIFREYGEIRESKKLAQAIAEQRKKKRFESAKELSTFIGTILKNPRINPATLAFQAIRIEVNNELGELETLLSNIRKANLHDCIVAIISFHSLEDRIVKNTFRDWASSCICPKESYKCECGNNHQLGKILTKSPILPTQKEVKKNPRARSAKMRVFHITKDGRY
jgi:16S rRNA (cytosine1402-N4)-methyltransferase